MKTRQIKLFENDHFLLAILLDGHIHVLLDCFLRNRANKYILSLFTFFKIDNNIISTSSDNTDQLDLDDELVTEHKCESYRRNIESDNINMSNIILEEFNSFLKRPRDEKYKTQILFIIQMC